ncbi:hypothetical protein [Mesorhizobium silamurunense]|uniref:hypothetical protein n=1 Tax=Mesorhizobium silamurunense TaxID=499528 RepID=UPI0017864A37|nr:hypothetical protein [Mesorhizobium silamurunense]
MSTSKNLTSGTSVTALHQLIVCGIAPSGTYAVLIVALVLISRSAKHAPTDQLAQASFIDIHDTAGLPFLIVVPSTKPSLSAKTGSAKALGARAQRSEAPALQLGGWA